MMIANDTDFVYNLRREILYKFKELGHEVYVVSQVLDFVDEYKKHGIELINVETERRGTNPLSDIGLFRHYKNVLNKVRPDIVFTNNTKPNIYAGAACKQLRIRYVANITGLGTAVEIPGKLQKLTTKMYKYGVSGAQTLFFQNEENINFFKKNKMIGKNSKTVLLPGSGVNLESHPYMEYPDSEDIQFLYIARVMKEKGIDILLEVAKRIRKERNDVSFHIVGKCDDEKYKNILREYEDSGIVKYHGLQKDVIPFYQKCACFLYPSYYPEGMSNVVLEACACGRPVIVADRAGCREPVDNGRSGFIVKVNDIEETFSCVNKFLDLSYEEKKIMGMAARVKVEQTFDRQLIVEFYMKEIERG